MSRVRSIRLPLPMIKATAAVYSKVPSANCKGLCQECCGPILMTRFEWDRIAARMGYYPKPADPFAEDGPCPMLKDGKCEVYDIRPLICRLWGSTDGLPCPFGCEPDGGMLSEGDGYKLMGELEAADRKHYPR